MKRFNQWSFRMGVAALLTICLLTGVVFAATTAGGTSDPLVSYSYFTSSILPDLLKGVEDQAEDVADDLRDDFDAQVAEYTTQMEELAAQAAVSGGSSSGDGAYAVLNLTAGQTVTLNAGDEVMLRIGSATVSGGSPALINTTGGTELSNGGSLVANNLYLCTIDGRTLTAGDASTWILLRQ